MRSDLRSSNHRDPYVVKCLPYQYSQQGYEDERVFPRTAESVSIRAPRLTVGFILPDIEPSGWWETPLLSRPSVEVEYYLPFVAAVARTKSR